MMLSKHRERRSDSYPITGDTITMPDYHIVKDESGRGDWAIEKNGSKVQNALTQSTAIRSARRIANVGDNIYVHTPKGRIRDEFTKTQA